MKATRQFMRLCLVIGMTIVGNSTVLAQGANFARTASFVSNSTSPRNVFRELRVGDKVPDFEFSLVNYSSSNAKLSDFKGKYIILDFWATWCSSCIHNFPEVEKLQKKHKDQLQVLLVNTKSTRDDEKKVASFFKKKKSPNGEPYALPSIVNDSLTDLLFPHYMIPHYVWINDKFIVEAITSSEQISSQNIESFISGKDLRLPVKKDLSYDFRKPLFINDNGGNVDAYLFRSFLTGYVNGIPSSAATIFNEEKKVVRIFSTNVSVLSLYGQAFPELANYPKNRMILNVSNRSKYVEDVDWNTWKYKNSYTYELTLPPSSVSKAKDLMKEDLKRYFGLKVYSEKRNANCFVLYLSNRNLLDSLSYKDKETNFYEKDNQSKYMHGRPIQFLVDCLNSLLPTPVVNNTNYSGDINIENLPADLKDVKQVRSTLKKYGLDLVEEKRNLDYFILAE